MGSEMCIRDRCIDAHLKNSNETNDEESPVILLVVFDAVDRSAIYDPC